jgi:CHASE1-domain containing sensor protein
MYLTENELVKGYQSGTVSIEVIKNQLVRYGQITADMQWQESTGHFREYHIVHFGRVWQVSMKNGRVTSVSL